jgi:hypothetical protein
MSVGEQIKTGFEGIGFHGLVRLTRDIHGPVLTDPVSRLAVVGQIWFYY